MITQIKTNWRVRHVRRLLRIGAALAAIYLSVFSTAYAEDTDPFKFDQSQWTSSKDYIATIGKEIAPPPAAPSENQTLSAAQSGKAPRDLALHLPALPPANKGFDVDVSSTGAEPPGMLAEEKAQEPQDIRLSDSNWKAPLPPSGAKATNDDDSAGDQKQLNIRLSFLPANPLTPQPGVSHASAFKLGHAQLKQNIPPAAAATDKTKSPAEIAACAALDQSKKQQLEAIQSDRRTLKALQDAIQTLGLTKQLNFASGTFSSPDTTTAAINTPQTAVR